MGELTAVSGLHTICHGIRIPLDASTGMNEMHAAQMQNEVDIMSLPGGLISNIGSWLDDREVCNMEVASKAFYDALSRPGWDSKDEARP